MVDGTTGMYAPCHSNGNMRSVSASATGVRMPRREEHSASFSSHSRNPNSAKTLSTERVAKSGRREKSAGVCVCV